MFNEEVRMMLIQVISSWQVLVVTVVLVLYVFLVNYVARIYRRQGRTPRLLLPKVKSASSKSRADSVIPSESDELGLEERVPPQKK